VKIIYTQNPLNSIVDLDTFDKKYLRLKVEKENLEDVVFSIKFYLTKENYNLQRALSEAEDCNLYTEEREQYLNTLFDEYVSALNGSHTGDCVCIPCTCLKCLAEEMLDIDTTGPGFSKYVGSYIHRVFANTNTNTCKDAIEIVENEKPIYDSSSEDMQNFYHKAELHLSVLTYLKNYRKNYLHEV